MEIVQAFQMPLLKSPVVSRISFLKVLALTLQLRRIVAVATPTAILIATIIII